VPSVDPKRLATRITTLVASRTPKSYVILDARATPHYQGLESDATRFGHIPEAKGIAISNNLAEDGIHLKSREELAKLYKDIPKEKKVITYCSVGIASSLEYLVMRELGYNVANYDASWKEWGNDPSLPIEDPAKSDAESR
jgi:thiosulfate/3-mercaptopyruvate sulfurtransferase